MKIMLKIWVLLVTLSVVRIKAEPEYLTQDSYYDPGEKSYQNKHQGDGKYEYASQEDLPSSDPKYYQSRYHKPEAESYLRQPQYRVAPQQAQYHQPEDPSYHRPQEIAYQRSPIEYLPSVHQFQQPYQGSAHYLQPKDSKEYQIPSQRSQYYQVPSHYSSTEDEEEDDSKEYDSKAYDSKEEDSKYTSENSKYSKIPGSPSSYPAPVPTDPKLPLYFTMYEKRVIQDPTDKYGKGPWRYLQYGHGITYGSKEPGKVFEKGYGYIRALGRDHCKLPEHLCPPRDEKPFDYEGRKEPYFGYRPH